MISNSPKYDKFEDDMMSLIQGGSEAERIEKDIWMSFSMYVALATFLDMCKKQPAPKKAAEAFLLAFRTEAISKLSEQIGKLKDLEKSHPLALLFTHTLTSSAGETRKEYMKAFDSFVKTMESVIDKEFGVGDPPQEEYPNVSDQAL